MSKIKKPAPASPALKLFQMLHDASKVRSRRKINDSLRRTMQLAVEACLKFAPGDFETIYADFGGHHWLGDGEYYYTLAIEKKNTSACQSFEAQKKRPPFIFSGKRLHLRASFVWDGRRVAVTSFGADHRGPFVSCCSYKKSPVETKPGLVTYHKDVVDKRFKVTLSELKNKEPKKDVPKPEPLMRKFLLVSNYCERGRSFLHNHLTARAAWEAAGNNEFEPMRRLLRDVKFPVLLTDYEALHNCDQVRALIGDFDTEFRPLLETWVDAQIAAKREQRKTQKEGQT